MLDVNTKIKINQSFYKNGATNSVLSASNLAINLVNQHVDVHYFLKMPVLQYININIKFVSKYLIFFFSLVTHMYRCLNQYMDKY